jgi:carbohydrate kinase (thermoresistant glucokinase family)
MGVAGSGKTTIASLLAGRLGWAYAEGDAFHPAANVAKMSRGEPLTDADRLPWLQAIAAWIDAQRAMGTGGIVSCSALKRSYRALLLDGRPDARLVYLRGDPALIGARMRARQGHFMPPSLLASQFATLEEPGPDEHPIAVAIDRPPTAIVDEILAALSACPPMVASA